MGESQLGTVIFILCTTLIVNKPSRSQFLCGLDDHMLPRGSSRICEVHPDRVIWLPDCDSSDRRYSASASACPAYVGITVHVKCPPIPAGQSAAVLRENKLKNNSRVLIIMNAQPSDAGEYECKFSFTNNTLSTSITFNISISTAIGLSRDYCSTPINYDTKFNCCSVREDYAQVFYEVGESFSLYTYGKLNISVQEEWITPATEHYPTDLGLKITDTNFNNGFSITVCHFPAFLNRQGILNVLAIVTITNSDSVSHSLCYPMKLQGTPEITVNMSLPEDIFTQEGSLAMFKCHFSTSFPPHCNEKHVLNYYLQNDSSTPVQQFNGSCHSSEDYNSLKGNYSLNVSITENDDDRTRYYTYKFYVHDVSTINNNSVLSCSVLYNNRIQWQNNATMVVFQVNNMESPETNQPGPSSANVAVPLSIVLATLLIFIVVFICFLFFCRRRRKQTNRNKGCITSFALVNVSSVNSENNMDLQCSEMSNSQISENSNPQREGITFMESWDDTEEKQFLKDNSVVYISYTDKKSEWVYNYLKPLIESWNSQVILHDEDMIPGFAISGERQRLILQAHRVVLVVSPDYSKSPWCLYELQHAITKEPVISHGKIIPIMVDGCQTLPTVINGIVPLYDTVENFELKLKKNICSTSFF